MPLQEGIAGRIKEFRKALTGRDTQQDFAQQLEIDQQRLSGYENGTKVPHQVIAKLVRMSANPYWLLFGEGEMLGGPDKDESLRKKEIRIVNASHATFDDRSLAEFYVLPLYADEVAAGSPLDMRDTEIEGPAVIHRTWCPHPSETDYVRVSKTGTSMEPTIPAGAIVTIDRSQNEPEEMLGKVVAIAPREGGVTLKRLRKTERGDYIGVPDNPNIHNHPVYIGEGDRIVGLVQTVHARLD